MSPISRAILAALAVFVAWTIVRALRSGRIYSEGWSFDMNESPVLFGAAVVSHLVCVGLLTWVAAGYTLPELWVLCVPR